MTQTIRIQSDSNAHDRPWRVAEEQGFFADEGLTIEQTIDSPYGKRLTKEFSERWKESSLQSGALEVYPVCEWGAIERVHQLGKGRIISLDTTVRTGALVVRGESTVQSVADLADKPVAVTWHAGTFYAAIETLEEAGVPYDNIKLVHAEDRVDALLSGTTEAAALMEPLVSKALAAGGRKIADLRWRGGIVASDGVDQETAEKILRALDRAVQWLSANESRPRAELLRDVAPEQRKDAILPELVGPKPYAKEEFDDKVEWMAKRGLIEGRPAFDATVRR